MLIHPKSKEKWIEYLRMVDVKEGAFCSVQCNYLHGEYGFYPLIGSTTPEEYVRVIAAFRIKTLKNKPCKS